MERKTEDFCSCEKLYYLKIFDRKCLVGTNATMLFPVWSTTIEYIMAIIIQFIHIVKLLYTYVQQINYTRGEVTLKEFLQTFFCADIADVRQTSIGHSG